MTLDQAREKFMKLWPDRGITLSETWARDIIWGQWSEVRQCSVVVMRKGSINATDPEYTAAAPTFSKLIADAIAFLYPERPTPCGPDMEAVRLALDTEDAIEQAAQEDK